MPHGNNQLLDARVITLNTIIIECLLFLTFPSVLWKKFFIIALPGHPLKMNIRLKQFINKLTS